MTTFPWPFPLSRRQSNSHGTGSIGGARLRRLLPSPTEFRPVQPLALPGDWNQGYTARGNGASKRGGVVESPLLVCNLEDHFMTELPNEGTAPAAAPATAPTGSSNTTSHVDVSQLVPQLAAEDAELARAAKRELWQRVRHAGRPGADDQRRAVGAELTACLQQDQPPAAYREVLWMLSEIGSKASLGDIGALLKNTSVREDARMALERIPGPEALAVLRSALEAAPEDFKIAIAQSLRARGEDVAGLPCEKLKPTKQTKVAAGS